MSDWIHELSAQLKPQQAIPAKKESLEQQLQAAASVDKLEMAVRDDVARWNELNPGYRVRIDGVIKLMPSGAFRVCKPSFPPAAVDAVLDPESFFLNIETTTVNPKGQEQCTAHSYFMLAPEKNGFRLMADSGDAISFAAASRILLEPLMASILFWAKRQSS